MSEVAEITRLTRDVRGLRLRLLDPDPIPSRSCRHSTARGSSEENWLSMASNRQNSVRPPG